MTAARPMMRRLAATMRNPETLRFVRFLLVGGVNTLVGYALFAILVFVGLGPFPSVIGATLLGMLFNFGSIGRVVFGRGEVRLLPRFVAVYVVQCLGNLALLHLATQAKLPAIAAEAVILPLLAVLSFFAMRRFVFSLAPAEPGALR